MSGLSPTPAFGSLRLPTQDTIQDNIEVLDSPNTQRLGVGYPYKHFARSALFTALTTSFVGLSMSPAMAATTSNTKANNSSAAISSDAEIDNVLDALRLKQAVEQGIIDRSVLEEYAQQTLGNKSNNSNNNNNSNSNNNTAPEVSDADLQQKVAEMQQRGYQMMTPEQIENELAALDILDSGQNSNNGNFNNKANNNISNSIGADGFNEDIFITGNDFNRPIATLDSRQPPIGLDTELDQSTLPMPSNLDTLNKPQNQQDRAETAEIMARPINVSAAVSSGRVDSGVNINQQSNPEQVLRQQQAKPVTGATDKVQDTVAQINAGKTPDVDPKTGTGVNRPKRKGSVINPDDYLPDYQVSTEKQAISESLQQGSKLKTSARNPESFIKRAYNRFFNGGVTALPHVETTVYIQQASSSKDDNSPVKLVKADDKIQPINNIKAALDDTTVQSVVDFTAALPRLRQSALDAARAVGYYDIALSLRQPNSDTIDVIIERLGEPVRVDSSIVDIRGEGSNQPEFQALQSNLPPKEGDIFNHRVYKSSKAALEALSNTYGYFDQYWLNKSVDIILPDNTADVSLVYNTGDRYQFDEVIFFTYDEATGTLTSDPAKLPVEMSLLKQLFDFEAGDPFYRPDITKFSNDLSATRYFNTVNVESILPPDERNENSTLAFDNTPSKDEGSVTDEDVNSAATASKLTTNEESGNAANNAKSASDDSVVANTGARVDSADIAPIEFEVDEQTSEKLQAIKQKATRLTQLPNNRVLDEKQDKAENILGKISDSISSVVKSIFPDGEKPFTDENFVAPTLVGRITPEQVLQSKKVPLYVFVSSDKPRDAQVGLGYGTDTGIRATAKIDYNLINRKGYQAGAEVELSSVTKNATLYGSRPWKHPLNDKLEARLTYEEEVINQGEGNFDLSTQTLKAALARNIRNENGWNRSYFVKYRSDKLETGLEGADLEDLPIRFVSSNPTQEALLFGYGVNKTNVDNVLNPTRGIRQYYSVEAGSKSLLSDTDMAIVRAGVSGLYSFGEDDKHQLIGRFNTGYIWADEFEAVPYKLRFFAGGDQSIRGFDYESLSPLQNGYLTGGQILAVGSAEYNYEFKPGFRGAFFTDVGNAYDTNFDTETKVGVGVGIRWASPVGTVRVDVAAGVTEESIPIRLHFFIGSPL